MAVPLLDLRAQYATIRGRVREAIDRTVESQNFVLGEEVESFEREAAIYCGCKHAIGCSSGTDALLLAMMAIGVAPGDEVITSAYTFFATGGCIARLGAKPVFADIDTASFNILSADLERLVTRRTKAIIPVHLFGQCAEMGPILAVARRHRLAVIEDAAQAIGAESNGQRAGSIGEIGCFSFYPAKNLGAFGDAGMVTTNCDALAARMRMLRTHGEKTRYHHVEVGGNFRLDALQAAVLRIKLEYLDRWTEARQQNAARYNRLFAEEDAVISATEVACMMTKDCHNQSRCTLVNTNRLVLPVESSGAGRYAVRAGSSAFGGHRHVYNQYVIRTGRREAVIASLKEAGIGHMIYYPVPLPLQECFANLDYKPGDFPASECAAQKTLALPIYPELTEPQQREVVRAVVRGLRGGE